MKTDIHPDYVLAHVTCSCGNEFWTRSTKEELHVEICAECHPFYTGKQKLMDTAGRVERFRRKYATKDAAVVAPTFVQQGNKVRIVFSENIDPCTVNEENVRFYQYARGTAGMSRTPAAFPASNSRVASGSVGKSPSLK